MLNGKIKEHIEVEIILRELFNTTLNKDIEKRYTLKDVVDAVPKYQDYIENLKKDFLIKKDCSVDHIAEQIFNDGDIDKNRCKMHILSMKIAIDDIYKELKRDYEVYKDNITIKDNFIRGKLALLNDIILDINELIWKCKEVFLEQPQSAKSGRRRLFSSNEIFYASKNLLRRYFYYNDISYSSTSVFLIRQSIEIKILNSLGIYSIVDNNEKSVKFKLETLVEFIDKNENIEFPIKKSLILKITKWTNLYIHRAFMHYNWEIILVHKVLEPLFEMGIGKAMMSIYGAVKIDKVYFNTKMYDDLLDKLGLDKDNVKIITMQNPEAIVE